MLYNILFSENEWVPVTPKKPEPKKVFVPASTTNETPAIMPPAPVQPPEQPPPLQPVSQTVFPSMSKVK